MLFRSADEDRRAAVFGDVHEELNQRVGSQNPEHLTPLFEILHSMPDQINRSQAEQLIERLSDRLKDNLNQNQQETILNQIEGFSQFYGKENQILDRIENLLNTTKYNNVREASEELLDKIGETEEVEDNRVENIRENYIE